MTGPELIRMACGHSVRNAEGSEIYNYYDCEPGTITRPATYRDEEVDTSGLLPGGRTWWVDTTAGLIDGSRMICLRCAEERGWR